MADGAAILVQTAVDAQAQQHALDRFQQGQIGLCQAYADPLGLSTLDRAVGVEQAAQETAIELTGGAFHGGRHRLVAGAQAQRLGQPLERTQRQAPLAAPGHCHPATEITAVGQAPRRRQGRLHDAVHPARLGPRVHRLRRLPHREDGLVLLESAVAHQQAQEIALLVSVGAFPGRHAPVVVEEHLVAGPQTAGLAPLGLGAVAGEAGHPADAVVGGQAQLVPLGGDQAHHRFGGGAEETLGTAGVGHSVHPRHEGGADEIAHLPRAGIGVHPGIGGDAGVGGADVFAEPVVVHLVDLIDEDEPRLGEIVGGGHDHVPQAARLHHPIDAAGHLPLVVGDVTLGRGPVAPHHLGGIIEVDVLLFQLGGHEGEGQGPFGIRLDRLDEFGGDQEGEVELAQAAVLALGADEVEDVRVTHVEGGHLRPAATAGGGDGETHLVVDVHEGQGPGGVGPGTGDVGPARAQGGKFVADAAVVDHHQAVVARQIIVVFLDGEVVEGLR